MFYDDLLKEATRVAKDCGAESVRIIHVLEAMQRRLAAEGGGFFPSTAGDKFSEMVTAGKSDTDVSTPPMSPRLERFIPEMQSCGDMTDLAHVLMRKQDDREGTSLLKKSGVQGVAVAGPPNPARIKNQRVQPSQVTIFDRENGGHQTLHLNTSGTYSPEP